MATDPTALIQTLLPLVLGKKETQTKTVPGNVTADFNAIMQSLMPNVQNSAVTQEDLDALFQSIFAKGQQSFAPNRAVQAGSGAYNSTALEALRNDALAKATNESIQAMLSAKLQANQQQTQAAQVAGQVAGQQGQLSSTTTSATPPGLGNLATPALAYSLYKMFADTDKVAKTGKVGGAAQAAAASLGNAGQIAEAAPSLAAASAIIPTFEKASKLYDLAGTSDAVDALGSIGDLGAIDYSMAFAAPTLMPTAATSIGGVGELAGASNTATSGTGFAGGIFGADGLLSGIGDIGSNIMSGISSIPVIGEGLASGLGAVGDAAQGVGKFFTPSVDIPGIGPTGVPILAGLGNFMEGDYAQGVGDIGATMALNAIPVVGPLLSIASGFTSNGVLDDWFGIEDCYITTATMAGTGNSDDNSYELTTMRKFRDDFMKATPAGQELINDYYAKAPAVVEAINKREDAGSIYAAIYDGYLAPAIAAIEAGDNYRALTIYREMSQAAEKFAYPQTNTGA